MTLRTMAKAMLFGAVLLALGACGGGGGGGGNVSPPPSTACVLGTSAIGSCTL
jgi:hypothetical protein